MWINAPTQAGVLLRCLLSISSQAKRTGLVTPMILTHHAACQAAICSSLQKCHTLLDKVPP